MRAVSQEPGGKGTGPPRPARRKPYSPIRKGLAEHIVSGRLRGTKLNVYLWLHLSANPYTGRCFMNAAMIALALGLPSRTANHILLQLRAEGYIDFMARRGSRKPFEITIRKFHDHFVRCDENDDVLAMSRRGGGGERTENPIKSIRADGERIKNQEFKKSIGKAKDGSGKESLEGNPSRGFGTTLL